MATTKKTTPVKKSLSKSTKGSKNTARPWTWRFSIVAIGIYTIAVASLVLGAFAASHIMVAEKNTERLNRINDIYSSLNIDDSYQVVGTDIFGDKRVYEWDKGRTYSSSIRYVRGDTVSNTFADLDKRIKDAGYTFVDDPYPGSVSKQYHYKTDKGEYIRMTVSSKAYNEMWQNATIMNKEVTAEMLDTFDKNAGPASVIIKVNLDDNNE